MRVPHRSTRSSPALVAAAAATVAAALLQPAHAGNTWDGGGANPSWITAANWTGNTLPLTTDVLVFGLGFASGTEIPFGASHTADSLLINTTAGFSLGQYYGPNYPLTLTSGIVLRQDVAGVEQDQNIWGSLVFPTDGIISINGSGNFTVASVSQTGTARALSKTGNGLLTLEAVSVTGPVSVNAGTLFLDSTYGSSETASSYTVYSGATLQINSELDHPVTLAGGTLRFSPEQLFSPDSVYGNVTLTANSTITTDVNLHSDVYGNLSDGGNHYTLTKAGPGSFQLAGNNAGFSGNVAVTGGTLLIGAASAVPAGTITVSSGASVVAGVSGTYHLTLNGAGDAGAGALNTSSGFNIAVAGNITLASASTIAGPVTLNAPISDGANSFGVTFLNDVTLNVANTFDGGVLGYGNLYVENASSLGSGTVNASINSALYVGNGVIVPNALAINAASATLGADNNASATYLGPVTATVPFTVSVPASATLSLLGAVTDGATTTGFTKTGLGRLVLGNSGNTYKGVVTLQDGTLSLANAAALGPAGVNVLSPNDDAALELTGGLAVNRPLTLNGGQGLSAQGLLRNTAGSNTWSGPVTVKTGAAASSTVGVDANTTLTLSGALSGTGTLRKAGAGRLILSGADSLPALNVASGPAQITTSAAAPSTLAISVVPGAAVEVPSTFTANSPLTLVGDGLAFTGSLRAVGGASAGSWTGPITLAANASVGVDAATTYTLSGSISDSGNAYTLTKVGQGTLKLTGANNVTGGLFVNGGTLQVSTDAALGPAANPVTVNNASRLQFSSSLSTSRTINANNGTLLADPGVAVTYSAATVTGGVLRGTGTHVLAAGASLLGTSTLNGTTVSQTGVASLSNFSNGGAFTSSAPLTWDAGYNTSSGTLTLSSSASTNNLTNDGLITLNSGSSLTNSVTPLVSGGGSRIVVNPSATLTLNSTSLDLYGALLTNNGTINGPVNVGYGATARGYGIYNGPVTVTDGGVFRADAAPSAPATLVVDSLTLAADTSVADINSTLVIDYTGPSPLPTLFASIQSAYHNGLWDKPGVTSSLAADPANGYKTAVAYADNASLNFPSFDGRPLDPTALLLKYTYYGDANLDGKITADDFALLDRGFSKHLTGWTNGDFNYDGTVTSADYLLIDRVYFQQGAPLSPSFLATRESQFGDAYVQSLIAAIPEPSSLFAACCGLAFPITRRRRR